MTAWYSVINFFTDLLSWISWQVLANMAIWTVSQSVMKKYRKMKYKYDNSISKQPI